MSFLHSLCLLSHEELDVAVGGQERRDSTVGSVGSSSALDSLVDSGVSDHALLNIQTLGLSIRLEVLEKLKNVSGRLFGPSSLSLTEDLGLCLSTDAPGVDVEGDDLFVFNDIFHISNGFLELKTLACSCSFISILKVSSEVGYFRFGS